VKAIIKTILATAINIEQFQEEGMIYLITK